MCHNPSRKRRYNAANRCILFHCRVRPSIQEQVFLTLELTKPAKCGSNTVVFCTERIVHSASSMAFDEVDEMFKRLMLNSGMKGLLGSS